MATVVADSASRAHVAAAISAASANDTISVPSGTETWSSELVVTIPLKIQGAGIGETVLTGAIGNTSSYFFSFQPSDRSTNDPIEITGFTFDGDGSNGGLEITGDHDYSLTNIRIHHCRFYDCATRAISINKHVFGVADHNQFQDNDLDCSMMGDNWYSWEDLDDSFGTSEFFFFEDNSFTFAGSNGFLTEGGHGGKYVFRHNTITDFPDYDIFDMHGNQDQVIEENSPGGSRATIAAEIYENTITSTKTGTTRLVYQRGGKALVFNNTITTAAGPIIRMTEEDDWSYEWISEPPAYDTVNDTYYFSNTKSGTEIVPALQDVADSAYIAHNSQYWTLDASFDGTSGVGVGLIANRPATCTTGVAYWATDENKLYKATDTDTWTEYYTPYTYPHPLTYGAEPGDPIPYGGNIMGWLKQSTAVTVKMGPFSDSTDGNTAETGLTIQKANVRLSKNGGDIAAANADQGVADAGAAYDETSNYDISLDTTDTNTLGALKVAIHMSGALYVEKTFMVVPANVYDALILGTDYLDSETAAMAANVLTAAAINADAITNAKIADDAIGAENLATGALTADAFAADALVAATFATNSIAADALASDAVAEIAAAGYMLFEKNVAITKFPIFMTDSTNHAPAAGKTVAVQLSKDGAAFGDAADTPAAEIGSGWYEVDFAQAEVNYNFIIVKATADGCDAFGAVIRTQS